MLSNVCNILKTCWGSFCYFLGKKDSPSTLVIFRTWWQWCGSLLCSRQTGSHPRPKVRWRPRWHGGGWGAPGSEEKKTTLRRPSVKPFGSLQYIRPPKKRRLQTHMVFLSCVGHHVSVQHTKLTEPFTTVWTHMVFLSCVGHHVSVQHTKLNDPFTTVTKGEAKTNTNTRLILGQIGTKCVSVCCTCMCLWVNFTLLSSHSACQT